MKKVFALLLTVAMTLSLTACRIVIDGEETAPFHGITKQDMVELGLSGQQDSALLRKALQHKLDLPDNMSANALLQALNLLYTLDEIEGIVKSLE